MSDSIAKGLAENVLRLGNEVRDLSISNVVLRDDNEKLKAEVERLKSLCDNLGMGGKHTVTEIEAQNARLKAEVKRLGIERISDIGMLGEKCADYARLKVEVEILKEAWVDKRMQEDRDALLKQVERLGAALRMAIHTVPEDNWKPIETAPMDGTDILCFCVEPEFEGEENPWTEFRVCFYGILTEGESCWMSHYGYIQHPTHWMSLPKPPIA